MSDNKQDAAKPEETDKELSELLDSALADFSKDGPKKTEAGKPEGESKVAVAPEQEWSEDFIRQAAEHFESNIASLLSNNSADGDNAQLTDQIRASLQKMGEAAQQAFLNPGITDSTANDYASTISQTIQGLNQGAENLQDPFSEQDIMSMFANLSGSGDQNSFLPFMQGMMQGLLSKEVLYPSLKDILEKYPGWLQENEATLSAEDKERYSKQQELMLEVCNKLETETESDSAEVRKERFDKILELMQKLQDYGQPPTEIVSDSGCPIDPQANAEQCSIM